MSMNRARAIAFALLALGLTACDRAQETPSADAAPAATPPADLPARDLPLYSATQFYETLSFGGSSLNAAGDAALVHSDESGVFNVYRVSLVDGTRTALTHSTGDAVFAESFFPADERILYSGDRGGDELDHVFVRETDGSVKDLTPGEKLKAQFLRFSRDGLGFFVMSNERDAKFFDVYRYDTTGYARRMVYRNEDGMQPVAVSGDGRWLALDRSNDNSDSDVFVVELGAAGAKPRHVTPHEGKAQHQAQSFTPDDAGIVYTTDADGEFTQAVRFGLEDGTRETLVAADWDVDFVYFSEDGRYRVSGINADASTEFRIVEVATGNALALPPLPPGDLRGVNFSRDGRRMVFYVNADTSPSNLFVYDMDGKPARQLTSALPAGIAESELVQSAVVRYPSTDELQIPALLFRPRQAASGKVPGVVYIHGGPGGQTRKGYNPTIQHLVNHGYAVLGVNNRGSGGYGKTFFHLDDRRHGEKDLEDIVAAKDYLQSLDWIDGERIAVMGGSYGGYLTMAAMAFTDAFDAGINIFGVTNWVRTLESIPPWWASFKDSLYAEMGDPATDRERLQRISPLFHAGNVRKPVLVIQGANDPRVLQVESDEMVAAIRANGVPVEYVLFPDEGHGFMKKENRIRASDAYLEFLEARLGPGTAR